MELPDSYDDPNEVPTEHQALYVEKDGKAVLQLTGVKSQDDFQRYGEALKKRYAEQAAKRAADANDLDLGNKDIKRLVAEAVKDLGIGKPPESGGDKGGGEPPELHDLRRELAAVKSELKETKEREQSVSQTAQANQIKTALQAEAVKSGIRPEAIDPFVNLIRDNFELAGDGRVVVKLEGNNIPGVTPNSSPADALTLLKRDPSYAYFWPGSKGAGSASNNNGQGGGGAGAENPWSAKGWNLTKQGQLLKQDRAEAERLANQAGSKVGATKPPE